MEYLLLTFMSLTLILFILSIFICKNEIEHECEELDTFEAARRQTLRLIELQKDLDKLNKNINGKS